MTSKYLLDQQRRQFEMNWDDELKNWAGDWDEMGCREIIKFKKEKELFVYLEAEMEGEKSSVEFIYHNLKNQKKEDRASMFRDIIEYAIDLIREYDEARRLTEQARRDAAEQQRLKMTPAQSKITKEYSLVPFVNIQAFLMFCGDNADLFGCLCMKYYWENKLKQPN